MELELCLPLQDTGHLRLSPLQRLNPSVELVDLGGLLPQLLILKLQIFDVPSSILGLLSERQVLNFEHLDQLLHLPGILAVHLVRLDNHRAAVVPGYPGIIRLLLLERLGRDHIALLHHLQALPKVSNGGLILLPLLLGHGVELVGAADIDRVVAVRDVALVGDERSGCIHAALVLVFELADQLL